MIKERKLSMPYWCVGNPVGDPFGPGVMDRIAPLEVTDIIAEAGKDGLVSFTAAHDDDLVRWDPGHPEDDLDSSSDTYKTLRTIKEKLDKGGVQYKMIGCALHLDPVFRNGGVANPDPRIRTLAAQKVMRALRIGHFLGAEYFTYWVARDGFETQFAVPWDRTHGYIREALNLVTRYCKDKRLSIQHATIESKPNEPRGEMFLPSVGHALAMVSTLEDPSFWGVNPEVLQHEQMTGLTAVGAIGLAVAMNKLFFLHVGNQKPNQFDNDNPPMIGMDGLKEFVSILYLLAKADWKGYVEFDNHMLRTHTAPGGENKIALRRKFIELDVGSYRLAEKKAVALAEDKEIARAQSALWDAAPEVARSLASGDPGKVAGLRIDYDAVVKAPIRIGELDHLVNRQIFGM
jgi:xylose isomerase